MSAWWAGSAESLAGWLVDFYALATLLLGLTWVAFRWLRQPVQRLTVAWIVLIELAVLALLCAVPGRPRIALLGAVASESPAQTPAAHGEPGAASPEVRWASLPQTQDGEGQESAALSAASPSTPEQEVDQPSLFRTTLPSVSLLLGVGFLLGLCLVSVWLCWGAVATWMLCRQAWKAPSALCDQLAEIVQQARRPRLLFSPHIRNAAALGVWRPAILLPAAAVKPHSPQTLQAVLRHEWAHIRNHDLWLLALGRCLFALLFAHPLYWWLRRRIRDDQELLADAVAARDNRPEYAERLLGWARVTAGLPGVQMSAAVGMWEVSSQLTRRIAMLLDDSLVVQTAASRRWKRWALAGMVLLGAACSLVSLQPAHSEERQPPAEKSAAAPTPTVPGQIAAKLAETLAPREDGQELLKLPVRVVDADGKPVAQARIIPWALRSSQGHGWWRSEDKASGVGPEEVVTGEEGTAVVLYPRYRDLSEQVRTIGVSLHVDHPDFAFVSGLHIDVPLESPGPQEIKLPRGVPVDVRPLVDGQPIGLDGVFLLWSDGRSWRKGNAPQPVDGVLRIPAMPPGKNSLMAVKLDGERASHFSKIVDFELTAGEPKKLDVALQPSLQIHGVLSDNVPRPVRQGRITLRTLPPARAADNRIQWFTWTAIQPDGTFTIDGWPAEERLQLIALCDGYIATSGLAPDVVENPRDPKDDPFARPQVFEPGQAGRITVAMSPLVPCVATAVDEADQPVAGVTVESWPNVGWWNSGSQIYGYPLARGERILRERDYYAAEDKAFPQPFQGTTDGSGKVTLELPAGHETLTIESNAYELPVFLGSRWVRVDLVPGQTTEALLRLQPVGSEKLGDWDKLAGVVFGCSTREGRQICALPSIRKRMDEFEKRFREAKNQRDPQLLAEAYTTVAEAFTGVGDLQEAAKWRQKAADQLAKVKAQEPTQAQAP